MKTKNVAASGSTAGRQILRTKFFSKLSARRLRQDGGEAFIRERDGRSSDSFATELGKDFLIAASSGREVLEELSDEEMPEENGGPFVETAAGTEFAFDEDLSNPKRAEAAAFPTSMRNL